jgi:DNA-binding response OmpR family regulator
MVMDAPQIELPGRVVIVEALPDARDVLCASLERRGLVAFSTSEANEGLELARKHHPDVIVFDVEAPAADNEVVQHRLEAESRREHSDLVILGCARFLSDVPRDRMIAKPYHFAPLIHKIEQIVELRRNASAADAAGRAA